MLSVSSVSSATGAAEYYAADNYYAIDDSHEHSEWAGQGAKDLGLDGPVEAQKFEEVLAGKLPNGSEISSGSGQRQPGMDLTFSAPKSVSLMALIGGDQRVIDAHHAAVKSALGWAEKNLAEVRSGRGGAVVEKSQNLLVALFHHDTSRARDPQLHSHAVVVNATRRSDGEWRALHNSQIWQANKMLGALYHNQLRIDLERAGYEIGEIGKNGSFELAGFSRETIEHWSQRASQINAIASQIGAASPEARGAIAVRSREDKAPDHSPNLHAEWQIRAANRGENFARMIPREPQQTQARGVLGLIREWGGKLLERVTPFLRPNPEPLVQTNSKQAEPLAARFSVAAAMRHLEERQSSFKVYDVLREALNFAEQKADIAAIEKQFTELVKGGELIAGRGQHVGLMTTRDLVRTERQILRIARTGQGAGPGGHASDKAESLIQQAANEKLGFDLKPEQLAAANTILNANDKIVTIQGDAGTGKSTIFTAINTIAAENRPKLLALTTQSGLAAKLQAESGIETRTIAHFLTRHAQIIEGRGAASADLEKHRGSTLIIDEASMVSSRQMLALMKVAEKLGIGRIALVGDARQIPSVEAGHPFAMLQERLGTNARLSDNIRQHNPEMQAAVAALARGDIREAFEYLGDRVKEHSYPADAAVSQWAKLAPETRATTAIFTSGHRLRRDVEMHVRSVLRDEHGERPSLRLTSHERLHMTREQMRHAGSYKEGLILDVHKPNDQTGLERGHHAITHVDQRAGTVAIEQQGRAHQFRPADIHPRSEGLGLSAPRPIEVSTGDQLLWTANDTALGITNNGQVEVTAINGHDLHLQDREGRAFVLGEDDPMRHRLMEGTALNMHRAQGQTVENAIAVLSSQDRVLNTESLTYVLASRAKGGFTLHVDDREAIIAQLERDDGKQFAALDIAGERHDAKTRAAIHEQIAERAAAREQGRDDPRSHDVERGRDRDDDVGIGD
ncbi:MAG: MobF family relaxase [Sphingomonadaceae bacterium]